MSRFLHKPTTSKVKILVQNGKVLKEPIIIAESRYLKDRKGKK